MDRKAHPRSQQYRSQSCPQVSKQKVNYLDRVRLSLFLLTIIFPQGFAFQVGFRSVLSRTGDCSTAFSSLNQRISNRGGSALWSSTSSPQDEVVTDETENNSDADDGPKLCYWKPPNRWWEERIKFEDLQVRQNLTGILVQDLLDGKTGPKAFFDCGIGKIDTHGEWQIVNGMMRLGRRNSKKSVAQKKCSRFRKKENGVELYVSRIFPESGRFEVMTNLEDLDYMLQKSKDEQSKMVSASTLQVNQELEGTVVKVEPYGAFIDVGANRNGLLHIQKVADLIGSYVDKETGLQEAGLERGARVRVMVVENQKKRLFFDFPNDVKEATANDLREKEDAEKKEAEEKERKEKEAAEEAEKKAQAAENYISDEEAAAWAEFAAIGSSDPADDTTTSDDKEEDPYADYADYADYDTYDEENDIEDSLGLGSY